MRNLLNLLVSPTRIELVACRLGGDRSIQLSYGDMCTFEYRAMLGLSRAVRTRGYIYGASRSLPSACSGVTPLASRCRTSAAAMVIHDCRRGLAARWG